MAQNHDAQHGKWQHTPKGYGQDDQDACHGHGGPGAQCDDANRQGDSRDLCNGGDIGGHLICRPLVHRGRPDMEGKQGKLEEKGR